MILEHLYDYFTGNPLALIILILFFVYLVAFIEYYFGKRSIKNLNDIPAEKLTEYPLVSIIIPARNEERNVRRALTSVLGLDYENYEVIIINDRSTDATGRILDDMAGSDPKLKIVHIKALPEGWLGKNYALDYGARNAAGKYLLFTDADVIYKPDTLSRAITFVTTDNIDHLSMAPSHILKKPLLTSVVILFEFLFMMKFKPWKVNNSKSKYFIGIGSFNLISADAYKKTGGFETLKMRPDDDIMLGKLVKKFGLNSYFIYAPQQLSIEWYNSVGELIRAFYKNTYAGYNYNIFNALTSIFLLFTVSLTPYISLFFLTGIGLFLNAGIILIIFCIYLILSRANSISVLYFITYPVASAIIVYLMLRAVILTIVKRGVDWRGTFYNLRELKSNRV